MDITYITYIFIYYKIIFQINKKKIINLDQM